MTRIRQFLLRDEIDETQISHEKIKNEIITVEDAHLGWSDNEIEIFLKGYLSLELR